MKNSIFLFQIVFKVLCDTFVQVHTVVSGHVMALARIGKEVGLGARFSTGFQERQGMLWHNGGIVIANDNLEFAFQVLGLADETGLSIAVRVLLRRVHIAFAVHHLIPLPGDDGTTSHANLEDIGIVGDQ